MTVSCFCKTHLFILMSITLPLSSQSDSIIWQKALQLSQNLTLVDGHIDLPYRLHQKKIVQRDEFRSYVYDTAEGDFDLKRAQKGGLNGAFMAVYIPAEYQNSGGARDLADTLFSYLDTITQLHPSICSVARNPEEVMSAQKANQFAIISAIENGAAIENNLDNLKHFKNKGLAYMTLCHGKDNLICDSSYDQSRTWNGLSAWGYQVLDEMQRLGIMIDISHVSDSAFYQVARYVNVPVIASHSSCRAFTPDFERNVSDDMIREIARLNGVVMVTFGTVFIDGKVAAKFRERRNRYTTLLAEKNIIPKSEEEMTFRKEFDLEFLPVFVDVSRVVDHIDHIVQLVGINHVGLGSDFDGVGDSLPTGLKDVGAYPNLIYHLLKRGYSEADIQKITSGNIFRVWSDALDYGKNNNR